jgi:hypothetical protein
MQAEPRQAFIRDMLEHRKKYKSRFFSEQENLYTMTILYAQQQMVNPKRDDEAPKERTKQTICGRLVYNDRELYGFVQMLTYKYLRFGKNFIYSMNVIYSRCVV